MYPFGRLCVGKLGSILRCSPPWSSGAAYACMIEASFYLKSFNTVQIWQAEYKNAIDGLRNQARRTRQDDMAQAASPAGSADTVIQGSS